jgi:hypothetical protein
MFNSLKSGQLSQQQYIATGVGGPFVSNPISIEDASFIVMQVGCNNLLGVYLEHDKALEDAIKLCKKQVMKVHIFQLKTTVESCNKVEVTGKAV